ncbi:MAG: OB-fold nucleic acid binding domain-containing protein [Candidatus Nanoarchaeia archaeon]|nr:OB-fold nucleic acid binding domain-containing protein [Candidatus Nanoarchaeia archaeon]MDD5357989.1 OB-fold nucleic acid binding domain-containing protein [Candidatus Nanoarchaeia archaeon]MDD5588908.1 OB-fold nucleic acid binding domain-containing protein [Candidatus Nanoarchaeia archaeon]
MTDSQFKRNVAYKFRIGDILIGKPIFDGERFAFLELGDKKIIRVNIIGNITDKYENEGEKRYCFLTLDDGSGQIKLKFFGDDVGKFKNVFQGQTVLIVGNLRNFNNETYIAPEIIREQDTKYLLIRKLELEREKNKNSVPLAKEQIVALKDKILDKIKEGEKDGGIEIDSMILNFRDVSPDMINQEIKKLLEEGIIFEPRPGKVRWLG